jgi:hypothetical protein
MAEFSHFVSDQSCERNTVLERYDFVSVISFRIEVASATRYRRDTILFWVLRIWNVEFNNDAVRYGIVIR